MNGDLLEPRQVARADRHEQLEPAVSERQAERAADRADDEGLDEQLSGDMYRRGAERGAYGELGSPRIGAHEHEVRDVGARDQQHRADRAHEHPERARDTADHVVLERPYDGRDPPVLHRFAGHGVPLHHRPGVEPNRHHALEGRRWPRPE